MAESSDHGRKLDPPTWPFLAGAWIIALFWLVVVVLAVLTWVFT
jgi:hypothetical protein